jgi:uncharacterized protein YbaR (Trm112 family)
MPFDYDKVKSILVCPTSKAALVYDDTALVSVDPETRASYPILDDIPRLLSDDATQLSPEDWGQVMQRHSRDATTGQTV